MTTQTKQRGGLRPVIVRQPRLECSRAFPCDDCVAFYEAAGQKMSEDEYLRGMVADQMVRAETGKRPHFFLGDA